MIRPPSSDYRYAVVNDFLTEEHAENVVKYIDIYGRIIVDISFSDILVKDPFTICLELTDHSKDITQQDKIAQIVDIFRGVNITLLRAIHSHSPIVN
jgi:hypothetical protein